VIVKEADPNLSEDDLLEMLNEVKPATPSPTAELRREGRLTRIAKALASGTTVSDIAEAEGIGRTLASRTANSPECRQLIAESRRNGGRVRTVDGRIGNSGDRAHHVSAKLSVLIL
jgi:hypothetical protein